MIFQSLWLDFVNGAGQSGRRFVFADIYLIFVLYFFDICLTYVCYLSFICLISKVIFQSLWLEFVNGASQSARRFVFADIEQLELTGQLGTRWLYCNVGHDDDD